MSGFSDPVIGGSGDLVYPQIQSPDFSETAQTGWQIAKNGDAWFYDITAAGTLVAGTIIGATIENAATDPTMKIDQFGNVLILNTSGALMIHISPAHHAIFIYTDTGSATQGSLVLSMAQTSGTDQFGNAYLKGFTAYAPGVIAGQLYNSLLAFFAAGDHSFNSPPNVGATGDGVTGATLAISSGAATGAADTADLVLYDSVAGNGYAGGAYISVDA
ncbi:MAG TPA: hypothetical protein VGG25_10335, partial [Streptosporangiaceae bacterium]